MSPLVYLSGTSVLNAFSCVITLESVTISQIAIHLMSLISHIFIVLVFTQNIMWNTIICLIEISIDVCLSRYRNHYLYQPNRWHLTKITLQLFDKIVLIKLH